MNPAVILADMALELSNFRVIFTSVRVLCDFLFSAESTFLIYEFGTNFNKVMLLLFQIFPLYFSLCSVFLLLGDTRD